MSNFLLDLIKWRPDLIGKTVYFCGTKKAILECIIRDDGTLSPASTPSLRYDSGSKLADGWKKGEIFLDDGGKKLPKNVKSTSLKFTKDLFLTSQRTKCLSVLLPTKAQQAAIELEIEENREIDKDRQPSPTPSPIDLEIPESVYDFDQENVSLSPPIPVVIGEDGQVEFSQQQPEPTTDTSTINVRKKRCPGFDYDRYQDAIASKKWDGLRYEWSPVVFEDGHRCRSKSCEGEIVQHRRLCTPCQKAKQAFRYAKWTTVNKPPDEGRRIMHSANRYLTKDDLEKKVRILIKEKTSVVKEILKKIRRNANLEKLLEKFRPEGKENQAAVHSITKYLNQESEKLKSPTCRWKMENGAICNFKTHCINLLSRHMREEHLCQQIETNRAYPPSNREYYCHYFRCRRRAPFNNVQNLRRHVVTHTGNAKTEMTLSMLQEQMINASRAPTGRRYSKIFRLGILRKYKSRQHYLRTKDMCPLDMPSLGTSLKWKNDGGIKSGVDFVVLDMMKKIGKGKPELRHGMLTFDEVYVNAKLQLQPASGQVFGYADDETDQLAKTVLMFQYVALFSTVRFAVSVAWYGCYGLNTDQLEQWLWEVMLALQGHGFRVHALVCDGHPINRSLQHTIIWRAKSAGQKDVTAYSIQHPLTPHSQDWRLFLFSDPSHGMKKFRNQFCTRHMAFDLSGQAHMKIVWDYLDEVRQWQWEQQRVERRLTRKHLELGTYEKMCVQTAVDVVSEPIEDVICEIDLFGSTGTREFMSIAREFWLCMNNSHAYLNENQADRIIKGLKWVKERLAQWKENTLEDPDKFLTPQTYEDVMLIVDGSLDFMHYIWNVISQSVPNSPYIPRIISQDLLENTFGILRYDGGGTDHITVMSIAYNIRMLNCNVLSEFMLGLNRDEIE